MNNLILGDCLEALKKLDSESVDLIYLDPPFFSNRNYEVIWGDKGEVRSFEDRWSGGVEHYIGWLKERVEQMHRVLKPTGSIFLHCDWHANAEIKVFILNKLFGEENFKGEIIWQRHNSHNDAKKKIAVLSDTIWYYSKSEKCIYNTVYAQHSDEYKDSFYKYDDNDGKGKYRLGDMASPNPRPNMMYEWLGYSCPAKGWRYEKATMQKLHDENRVYYPKDKAGNPDYTKRLCLKRYLEEQKGSLLGNIWTDINNVQSQSKERIGYPTQKPEALLERIINMASNEGDLVLDPFVGGGTTIAVANRLKRQWIGIDSSVAAIKVTEMRLDVQHGNALKGQTALHTFSDFFKPFTVQLHKYDYDTLRYKNAFEFEKFIVQQFGGISNAKQRNDLGLDGKTQDGVPIQVKRSDNIGRNVVDNFQSACKRYWGAQNHGVQNTFCTPQTYGIIIAFSFGKGAIEEVARLKNQDGVIIELKKVDEIIPIEKKPILKLTFEDLGLDAKNCREIVFRASATSNSGIEFFAWDFDYSAEKGFQAAIMMDKEGQQSQKFKAGTHSIAVKVVDNDGLESVEVIVLKINGEIHLLK